MTECHEIGAPRARGDDPCAAVSALESLRAVRHPVDDPLELGSPGEPHKSLLFIRPIRPPPFSACALLWRHPPPERLEAWQAAAWPSLGPRRSRSASSGRSWSPSACRHGRHEPRSASAQPQHRCKDLVRRAAPPRGQGLRCEPARPARRIGPRLGSHRAPGHPSGGI